MERIALADCFNGESVGEVDVLLCQPPLTLRIPYSAQPPVVRSYFDLQNGGDAKLAGDDPWEANSGVLLIGEHLIRAGLRVAYLDLHALDLYSRRDSGPLLSAEDISRILSTYRYKLLAISTMAISERQMAFIANQSKAQRPDVPVVAGGLLPTAVAEVLQTRYPYIDHFIAGDGRQELLQIALETCGKPDVKVPVSNTRNFDILASGMPFIPRITLTQGCHAACAFCSPIRLKASIPSGYNDAQAVQDALLDLSRARDYENFEFFLIGNLSFLGPRNAADWLFARRLAASNNQARFWCQMRPDDVTEQSVDLLARAGCFQIAVGIETPSWSAVRRHGKAYFRGNTPPYEYPKSVLNLIKSRGIATYAYFMIGMPGEDEADVEGTISLISELLDDGCLDGTHISIPVPYPGTPWYSAPERYGIRLLTHDYSSYWMNSDPLGYGDPVFETNDLSAPALRGLWERALGQATQCYRSRSHRFAVRQFNTF